LCWRSTEKAEVHSPWLADNIFFRWRPREACAPPRRPSLVLIVVEEIRELSVDRSHCAGEERRKQRSIRRPLDGYGDARAPAKTESPPHYAGEEPRKQRSIRRGSVTEHSSIAGFCGKGDSFYSTSTTIDTLLDYGDDDYGPQNAKVWSRCEMDYGYGGETACAPAAKSPPPHCAVEEPKRKGPFAVARCNKIFFRWRRRRGFCAPAKAESPPPHCAGGELRKQRSIRWLSKKIFSR
jgi:hypothetical protein